MADDIVKRLRDIENGWIDMPTRRRVADEIERLRTELAVVAAGFKAIGAIDERRKCVAIVRPYAEGQNAYVSAIAKEIIEKMEAGDDQG